MDGLRPKYELLHRISYDHQSVPSIVNLLLAAHSVARGASSIVETDPECKNQSRPVAIRPRRFCDTTWFLELE